MTELRAMTRPILFLPPQTETREMTPYELLGRCWIAADEDSMIVAENEWYIDALSSDMDHFWRCVNDKFELRIANDVNENASLYYSNLGTMIIALLESWERRKNG